MVVGYLDSCECHMAEACAMWRVRRVEREGRGDKGHGELNRVNLEQHRIGTLSEMAFARYRGVYWMGGAEEWRRPDVDGYQVRGTWHQEGSLIIFEADGDQPCVLITLNKCQDKPAVRFIVAGYVSCAADWRTDEYFQSTQNNKGLREGSPPQWWVDQRFLKEFGGAA